MTDIERLRNLPVKWREVARMARADGLLTAADAYDQCADELEAKQRALLADYERLRGMEERLGADLQCLVNGETPDGDGVAVNVSLWAERWIERLLVPVPGGE
jgi:hypothetical protein